MDDKPALFRSMPPAQAQWNRIKICLSPIDSLGCCLNTEPGRNHIWPPAEQFGGEVFQQTEGFVYRECRTLYGKATIRTRPHQGSQVCICLVFASARTGNGTRSGKSHFGNPLQIETY